MKKKKLFVALCAVGLAAIIAGAVWAITKFSPSTPNDSSPEPIPVTPGVVYELSSDGTYAVVTGYKGTETQVWIADTYREVPVTEIRQSAFSGQAEITEVIIPDGVTTIQQGAFGSCGNLKSVSIPDSVTSIAQSAFEYCESLQYAEYGNAKYLGNAKNAHVALVLANGQDYSSHPIHPDTKMIADFAFATCQFVTEIEIPNGVISVGESAFRSCPSLTSVVVSGSVKSLGMGAFVDCYNLSNVTISDGVKSIGEWAFTNCSSLTSIMIPDSMTCIGGFAFSGCDNLQYTEYENAKYLGNAKNPYVALMGPSGSSTSFLAVHSGAKLVAEYAFKENGRITKIEFPVGMKHIGGYAFSLCKLTSLTLGDVETIGEKAFATCQFMTTVKMGNVKSIAMDAFSYCTALTSLDMGDVERIGDGAFRECAALATVTMGDVGILETAAFENCAALTSLTMGDVGSIGVRAFNCCSMSTLTLGNVGSICEQAFKFCASLKSLTIGSVENIAVHAFQSCMALEEIIFKGTMEEWKAVEKGGSWYDSVLAEEVKCSDGNVEIWE